jgi:hypothetical protein
VGMRLTAEGPPPEGKRTTMIRKVTPKHAAIPLGAFIAWGCGPGEEIAASKSCSRDPALERVGICTKGSWLRSKKTQVWTQLAGEHRLIAIRYPSVSRRSFGIPFNSWLTPVFCGRDMRKVSSAKFPNGTNAQLAAGSAPRAAVVPCRVRHQSRSSPRPSSDQLGSSGTGRLS